MTRAEGGSPWAGRRRARCSGAPPPSRASRGTWATPDPQARGRYRRSSPGRRGCPRPAPRGKRGAAHRLRGRARGRVSRGRGRHGAGSAKSAMWVGIVIFLVPESVTSATETKKPARAFGRGRRVSGQRRTCCAVGHCDCHARRRARVRCRSGLGRRGARASSRLSNGSSSKGELRLIFLTEQTVRRHRQSWLSATRDSCLFGEFPSLRRLRLSLRPRSKNPARWRRPRTCRPSPRPSPR